MSNMCLIIFEGKAEVHDQYTLRLNLVQKDDDPIQDYNRNIGSLTFLISMRNVAKVTLENAGCLFLNLI